MPERQTTAETPDAGQRNGRPRRKPKGPRKRSSIARCFPNPEVKLWGIAIPRDDHKMAVLHPEGPAAHSSLDLTKQPDTGQNDLKIRLWRRRRVESSEFIQGHDHDGTRPPAASAVRRGQSRLSPASGSSPCLPFREETFCRAQRLGPLVPFPLEKQVATPTMVTGEASMPGRHQGPALSTSAHFGALLRCQGPGRLCWTGKRGRGPRRDCRCMGAERGSKSELFPGLRRASGWICRSMPNS